MYNAQFGYTAPESIAATAEVGVRPYSLYECSDKALVTRTAVAEGSPHPPFAYDENKKTVRFTIAAKVSAELINEGCKQIVNGEEASDKAAAWVTVANEDDITGQVKSVERHISTAQVGVALPDGSYLEGMLVDDIIVEFRKNTGQPVTNATQKFQRAGSGPQGYGLSYLNIGIPDSLVTAIVRFLSQVHHIHVEPDTVGKLHQGYRWHQCSIKLDSLVAYADVKGSGIIRKTMSDLLLAVKKHVIGIAHLSVKLLRTADMGSTDPNCPFRLSFSPTLFQLRTTTDIAPIPIGSIVSTAAVTGYNTVSDPSLVAALTRMKVSPAVRQVTTGGPYTSSAVPSPWSTGPAAISTGAAGSDMTRNYGLAPTPRTGVMAPTSATPGATPKRVPTPDRFTEASPAVQPDGEADQDDQISVE